MGRLELRIDTGHEQSHSKGSSHIGLCCSLVFVGQISHNDRGCDGSSIDVFVIEAFVAHVLGQGTSIRRQTGNPHANVVVDFEKFLLVAREFADGTLECSQDNVGLAFDAYTSGTLLYGFLGVFDLYIDSVDQEHFKWWKKDRMSMMNIK